MIREPEHGPSTKPPDPRSASEVDARTVERIRRRLLSWGRSNFQHYVWREETDPWLSLAAEILLQRTRARQVEPVFEDFRQWFPTAESLVSAGQEAARYMMSRLGLYWRGDLLYSVARAVSERGGVPPEDPLELRKLTGVGPYTAAAWLSLHRGKRAVIVDSNIARWLSRVTGRPYQKDPRHIHWILELADRLTPRRAFREYNYAVLDFTMHVCTVRAPRCDQCPVRPDCDYGRHSVPSRGRPSPALTSDPAGG